MSRCLAEQLSIQPDIDPTRAAAPGVLPPIRFEVLEPRLMLDGAPTNVLLFIGDGMGPEQVRAGGYHVNGAEGTLSFESFPHSGEIRTYAANSSVTDSAAAATAIATAQREPSPHTSSRARSLSSGLAARSSI